MPWKTNTLLTVLNLSFKARAGNSLDLPLFITAGRDGGSYLVLRDLRMSKNYWKYLIVIICGYG
jgi:hypothetical protein